MMRVGKDLYGKARAEATGLGLNSLQDENEPGWLFQGELAGQPCWPPLFLPVGLGRHLSFPALSRPLLRRARLMD